MPVRAPLRPGQQTPLRPVPSSVVRPEYVGRSGPERSTDPWVQDPEVIEKMRHAGRIAARSLVAGGEAVKPGATTDEVDRVIHEFLVDHGAYPSTLGYRGFPKSCCTSLNEVICHGIPDSTVIEDGDIVNIDVTAYVDGVHGDTNATFLAGEVAEEDRLLVERTHEATMRAIRAVKPGRELNVVGRVIGRTFHSGLVVVHYDDPSRHEMLEPGMTFTIEPMITLGTVDYDVWDDGWTVTTKDKSRTAQFEHTILVTDTGSEILTLP